MFTFLDLTPRTIQICDKGRLRPLFWTNFLKTSKGGGYSEASGPSEPGPEHNLIGVTALVNGYVAEIAEFCKIG